MLQDLIKTCTSTVFLNTVGFGETVTHRIQGSVVNTESLVAIIDHGRLEDAQEQSGLDALVANTFGRRTLGNIALELLDSVTIDPADTFVLPSGLVASAIGIVGNDHYAGTITVACYDPGVRSQIYFQSAAESINSSGQPIATWSDTGAAFYAQIEPLTGLEKWLVAQVQSVVTHRIRCPYVSGRTSKNRVRFGARYFPIESLLNRDEQNLELELLCKELT